MSEYIIQRETLVGIANAVRTMTGTTGELSPNQIVASVSDVETLSAQTFTPSTADQTIASGKYLAGVQTIKGDPNLIAANIKLGVSIFGVVGTYEGEIDPPAYTNLLPLATDKDGNIYNGIGYKPDTRISTSSGTDVDKDEANWYATGYIPVKTNDVVRFKNCLLNNTFFIDGTNRQQILYFDTNKNLTGYSMAADIVQQSTSTTSWNAVLDDDSNIVQVSIPASTSNIDVSYMRIVAQQFNENSIITVNEEIV